MRRVVFLVFFFVPFVAWASAIFRPLEEVIPLAPVVFTAEIVSAKETQAENQIKVTYQLKDVRALRGTPSPSLKVAEYKEVVVPNAAPVLDGSGVERTAKSGRFIFFTNAEDPATALRLEPAAQEPKVKELLARIPVRTATPPASVASSAPWTPEPVASAKVSPVQAPGTSRGCGSR